MIDRKVLERQVPSKEANGDYSSDEDDAEVYTYVRLDEGSGRWLWHQEVDGHTSWSRRSSRRFTLVGASI